VGIGGRKGGHWWAKRWALVGEKVGIGGRLLKNEIGLSLFHVI